MIKSSPGDASECDRRCDGDSIIANDEHTACGMIVMKVYGTELKITCHRVYCAKI